MAGWDEEGVVLEMAALEGCGGARCTGIQLEGAAEEEAAGNSHRVVAGVVAVAEKDLDNRTRAEETEEVAEDMEDNLAVEDTGMVD